MNQKEKINPENCPLCGKRNYCGNLDVSGQNKSCWCTDSTITFPDGLLSKVPTSNQNKACICKACVLAYQTKDVTLAN